MAAVLAFRQAVRTERVALEALQRSASIEWPDYREAILANPDAIELPADQIDDGRVVVVSADGVLAGFVVVLPRGDGEAELDGLFVEPALWRRGIGRALMSEADRLAATFGSRMLHVVASPRAVDFYRACGFEPAGKAETRFGPAVTMTKKVA